MPSFVLSLALLLLVVMTLLALSNRELVALTFLGFSTVALPLSVWIFGAIAVGFLLGLWILLLFRFGTAGVTVGSGRGVPFGDQRRSNYGPEDFAVVDERFAGSSDHETGTGYGDRRYDATGYGSADYGGDRYDDSRYSDNRYDDIYGRQDGRAAEYDSGDYNSARYGRAEDRAGYGSASRSDSPRSGNYSDRAEPQDSFSAASGYETGREASTAARAKSSDLAQEAVTGRSQADIETATAASTQEPTVPADWNDPYREDWTEAELMAEPVLRNETTTPKLKRWFGSQSQSQLDASQPKERLSGPAETTPLEPEQPQTESANWRPTGRDQSPSENVGNVYDADYRIVQPAPEDSLPPRPASQPQSDSGSDKPERPPSRDRASSEWDIESDLDW